MSFIRSKHCVFTVIPGILLMVLLAASVANAQIPLQATLAPRPVTPGDIANYKLPSTTEIASGNINIGLGQPAYLEVEINIAVPASDIAGVTWTLLSKPAGSNAAITNSPLAANMPVFEPANQLVAQVAGRALLRPDVLGEYEVSATVTTNSNGSATIQQTIFGATYAGISTCSGCHDGSYAALNKVATWSTTAHASIFTNEITGANGNTTYPQTCWQCHTVGYDPNDPVQNGGFDKIMAELGWTEPTTLNAAAWSSMPAALQNVANVQCENCHGAGSLHAVSGGTPIEITVPTGTGACSQCHDDPPHHIKTATWEQSAHAVTTTDPAGNASCVGCHTNNGFIGRMSGATTLDTTYGAIECETCHEPHGQTIPSTAVHLIRNEGPVVLADGTKVSDAGAGSLCMECHQAREAAATYVDSTPGSSHWGPHEGPQADMLEGVNGYTYGQTIPTSAHQWVVQDTCVGCHMQTVASTDPAYMLAGDHTFKMSATPAGASSPEDIVAICQTCHGPDITQFNFPLFDYANTGTIQGVQTEVQDLLNQLSTLLPPAGQPKTSLSIDSTWTKPQLEAAWNWLLVTNDGSLGIHNTAYTVGLLKASIANLSAASNPSSGN